MDRRLVFGTVGNDLLQSLCYKTVTLAVASSTLGVVGVQKTHQLVKHAAVELVLGPPTLPQAVVVVLQTVPVLPELRQAVRVDVLDPIHAQTVSRH